MCVSISTGYFRLLRLLVGIQGPLEHFLEDRITTKHLEFSLAVL